MVRVVAPSNRFIIINVVEALDGVNFGDRHDGDEGETQEEEHRTHDGGRSGC